MISKLPLPATLLSKCALSLLTLLISSQLFIPAVHAQAPPLGRPILFVHGWCGDGTEWEPLRNHVIGSLTRDFPTLYPTPQSNYYAYYNASADFVWFEDNTGQSIGYPPSTNRIFSIKFYDPVGEDPNPEDVARVSILNKAYELSRVIKEIARITTIKDVILVTHSMGGLVARSYVENLGSQRACYNYGSNPIWDPSSPNYVNGLCRPGQSPANYTLDIADIITLDTPHGGTEPRISRWAFIARSTAVPARVKCNLPARF